MSLEKVIDSLDVVKETVISSDAFNFGGEDSLPPPPQLTAEEEKKLWRKIDTRLLPILTLLYLLSFMDRGNIGNARIQGLDRQLHLTGNQFNVALTVYFIPNGLLDFPANLVLKKFRPSRWLPGITVLWGAIVVSMGFVKTYPQLVGVRACLGVAEAGLFPGIIYYLTIWYPRYKVQSRIGFFVGAASLAGAFSGFLAFGISNMNGMGGLQGWSWIFIMEGILTCVAGFFAFYVMVDFPVTAKFLTPEERAFVIWKKKYDNSSVGEEEHFAMRHIWDALSDWQIWLHSLIAISVVAPVYGITFFLPTIIHSFGYNLAISQLLTIPPYLVATIGIYFSAVYSDKIQMRSPFILAGISISLMGFTINATNVPTYVKYMGTYFCVVGAYAALPGVIAWLGNNLAGQYKRGVGVAIQVGMASFGGAMACNFYRRRDAPGYLLGHVLEIMFLGMGFVCVPFAVLVYNRINRTRDTEERVALESGEVGKYSMQEIRMLGDRAPDFRYTL